MRSNTSIDYNLSTDFHSVSRACKVKKTSACQDKLFPNFGMCSGRKDGNELNCPFCCTTDKCNGDVISWKSSANAVKPVLMTNLLFSIIFVWWIVTA